MADIRRLGAGDTAAWLRLRLALWPKHTADEFRADIRDMLADDKTVAFGAFEGEELIAFAEAGERPWGDGFDTAPVGWLEGIYVSPAYRRKGVAAALVETVHDWARSRGYAELGSDTTLDNTVSIQRHAQWGFAVTERQIIFRRRLDP
ncbi:MAG TPA: GNAT family N-acetyltransferase [Devosiaceae bacterium]|jgi:aminoglycoside 6'-N-acetyltransferase I